MNSQTSTAVRGAIALIAAGSAVALTACSAGQISQTNQKVPAVNGVAAQVNNIDVRDATVVLSPSGEMGVKFTVGNNADGGRIVTLKSVTIRNQPVTLNGPLTIAPDCNLVADIPSEIKRMTQEFGASTCPSYVSASFTGLKDLFPGGQENLKLQFDSTSIDISAPVAALTPEAGESYRGPNGVLTDEAGANADASHAEHSGSADHSTAAGHSGH